MRVVWLQGLIAIGLAAVGAFGWGLAAGRSVLMGGAIGIAATLFLVIALFRHGEGTAALRIAWGFFIGQGLKIVVTIGLLALCFRARGTVPLALVTGYAATYVAYWFAARGPASRW